MLLARVLLPRSWRSGSAPGARGAPSGARADDALPAALWFAPSAGRSTLLGSCCCCHDATRPMWSLLRT